MLCECPELPPKRNLRFDIFDLLIIILIIVVLLLIGVIPAWPYSRTWGPYPSGGLRLMLLILIVLMLLKVF
ncbi:MAG: hypothetical protein QOJ51_4732 [Acidobacteriaceae bacterium]|nr:hypothetical protein [Acidobacteriaceae bacterium]